MELSRFITRVPSASRFRTELTQDAGTGVFVDLMIDRNFKMVFTKESNKDVLIDMLNCFLQDVDIRSLKFLPQGQNPGRKDLVASVFDVSCITADGRRIVVEVQYNERKDYLDRVLYYATWPIAEQIAVGTGNYRLNEVYVVSLLNFALEHDSTWDGGVVSSYSIREDGSGEKMTDARGS